MDRISSILVVVERASGPQHALSKACVLARHFGAKLELFLCDAEHAYALQHAYDLRGVAESRNVCVAEARLFVEALRKSVAAEDLIIDVDAACESPLHEGIVRKALRSKPDLVVKSVAANGRGQHPYLSAADWQLARTCPVPLMLVRGRPWQAHPRFAAAVDVSVDETPNLATSIARTAAYLSLGCRGTFDIFHGARKPTPETLDALRRLGHEFQTDPANVHLVAGEPAKAIPAFAKERDYDLIVMGALTHGRPLTALVGTLTGTLVDAVKSDLMLMKSASFSCPIATECEDAAPARAAGNAKGRVAETASASNTRG